MGWETSPQTAFNNENICSLKSGIRVLGLVGSAIHNIIKWGGPFSLSILPLSMWTHSSLMWEGIWEQGGGSCFLVCVQRRGWRYFSHRCEILFLSFSFVGPKCHVPLVYRNFLGQTSRYSCDSFKNAFGHLLFIYLPGETQFLIVLHLFLHPFTIPHCPWNCLNLWHLHKTWAPVVLTEAHLQHCI